MALTNSGLFLYGYQISSANNLLDFRAVNAGPQITATLKIGFYSLTTLLTEVARAMGAADSNNVYTATAARTFAGGTQNRITLATSGAFLSLLAGTGTNSVQSPFSLLGYSASDKTGSTSYQAQTSSGTAFQPAYVPYNYLSPDDVQKVDGVINQSSSGNIEAVIYSVQKFWQLQVKYISQAEKISSWQPFLQWAQQKKLLEYTPDITVPGTYYEGWFESGPGDAKGLGYRLTEMIPQFANFYDTGLLTFRVRPT